MQAILFYGSCLRSGDDRGGMVDLYVIVERYRSAYRSAVLGRAQPAPAAQRLLPGDPRRGPGGAGQVCRALPGGFRARHFARLVPLLSLGPIRAADRGPLRAPTRGSRAGCIAALGQAVVDLSLPGDPLRCRSASATRQLWLKGLSLSYRAELQGRAARESGRPVSGLGRTITSEITAAALPLLPYPVDRIDGRRGLLRSPDFARGGARLPGRAGGSGRSRASCFRCCGC
ncbi:MAG: hypothetical protein MZV70_67245 [Desulfobacterales bacterium]|nr:hypothetical protein [Desulfobacterales bacterium]